ncbi:hypothetical protein BO70DRAFT_391867 [Aspergillus heteromorphus CBS 117.55]|uniref:Uncharacterized protein n=1 Tax=Aspergillus heteromorphus CBS 117.55 TaxID=1448321 RepID=A0A317X1N4_9EURO|nr:uncharacterized protein BO70DRAFT_391867 [Aspergillus heteromorphus CBS 117.55]PWY92463.1 hypothetical protein BO70DRAFT_391867 [Aspergillus heteromorphus CBS 117.55]
MKKRNHHGDTLRQTTYPTRKTQNARRKTQDARRKTHPRSHNHNLVKNQADNMAILAKKWETRQSRWIIWASARLFDFLRVSDYALFLVNTILPVSPSCLTSRGNLGG